MRVLLGLIAMLAAGNVAAGVSEWIPFQQRGGHIVVPATLNGDRGVAILDTGANGNAISQGFLDAHEGEYGTGKSVIVSGVYGERRVKLVNNISVGMFGSTFRLDELMPMNMGGIGLLIGLPFFQQFIVQIDYPAGRLRLIDHESLNLKSVANVRMKHSRNGRQPIVEINLNGEYKTWAMLDTGNSGGVLLPRKVATRFGWIETFGTQSALGVGVNSVGLNERMNIPTMTIGPYELENVIVTVPTDGQVSNIGRGPEHGSIRGRNQRAEEAILGYDVLRHFIVTIDYKNKRLHLEIPPPLDGADGARNP